MGSPSASYDPTMDCCDVANSNRFMEALVNFLNEAGLCMKEVRQRAGLANDCSPVQMNEEERVDKMSHVLCNLNQKYQMEKRKSGTANQTPAAFVMERGYYQPSSQGEDKKRQRQRAEILQYKQGIAGGQELFYEPGLRGKPPVGSSPGEYCPPGHGISYDPSMMEKTPGQLQRTVMEQYGQPGQEICYESGLTSKETTVRFGRSLGQHCPADQQMRYEPGMTKMASVDKRLEEYCPMGQEICYESGIMGMKGGITLGQECPSDQRIYQEPGKALVGRSLEAKPRVPRSFIENCSTDCKNVVRSGGKTW